MKPIRILVDSFADADGLNAQMINARDIISRLDPRRFEVSTFCRRAPDPRLAERPATRLIQLGARGQTLRILREFLWGSHQLLFYIKGSPAARLYLQLRRAWRDRRIVIGTVESQSDLGNESSVKPEQIRIWEQTILRSDVLFSNSASVQASLKKEYGRDSEVIPTGVDAKFFTPAYDRAPHRRTQVLFVGSLRPFKGPQLMLRAAARFPAADFVVVGDGIMAAELASEVRQRQLVNLRLLPAMNRTQLREQYRQADLFLFPSKWEGSPKVILEAAACGIPVIARNDYRPETVVDGQTGYLGGSDDALLDRLGRLLDSPEARRQMGRAGRALSEQFDWDLITRRWEEVFTSLAARAGSPAR
jgi:glycosyltransferase involved in cell wall biosynthesis